MKMKKKLEKVLKVSVLALITLSIVLVDTVLILNYFVKPKTIVIENELAYDLVVIYPSISEKEEVKPKKVLTEKEKIIEEIKKVFGDDWKIAYAIAMAESKMNCEVVGDGEFTFFHQGEVLGDSIGLFQIRTGGKSQSGKVWSRPGSLGVKAVEFKKQLKDPIFNIGYAKQIYDRTRKAGGVGWEQWSTYQNGTYKKFL